MVSLADGRKQLLFMALALLSFASLHSGTAAVETICVTVES